MTRAFEITLRSVFNETSRVFIGTFAASYEIYERMPVGDFLENLKYYQQVIEDNCEAIYRLAAKDINKYLQTYEIHANKSADEFKIIYFLGRAIEKHLIANGYVEISRVHMFTLVGLMDYRLRHAGVSKPQLTRAMTKLIRLNILHEELGDRGFYLTYKCVATTARSLSAGM